MGGGGGYLLLVLNPPWTPEHKEAILKRVAKGLLSWDVKATGADLTSAEKACLSVKVSAGPHNELLIQHSTETLALEVLLNPEVSTLRQCFKNMMVSGTTHKHVIHAGYAFAGSGDWILQDGVFSAHDVETLLHDAEVQEVLRRQKFHTLHVHCSPEGSWKQPPVGVCLNPPDIADSLAGSAHLLGCLDAVLTSPPLTSLLPSSSVVGNIRFRRPTMYVFPGGQGDCALFGVTGFTLLVDGGFARKPCFWEFVRHLDRLDSLLVTRFNQFNSCGLTALAQRKALERVYPQVGHVFCNAVRSPSDEELQKDRDQLVVSVVAQGLEFLQGVREMGLSPQACQRDMRPHTLYHKVGHGTLEMFVLSPGRSTEEDTSVCALLVWRPAKVSEPVTRILLPGSASQSVIFEGLNKLGHLTALKSREVTAEARLGLKKSKVQGKPLRATSVPPRTSVAKRAAVTAESPSPSPTPPPEKVRATAKPTSKSLESQSKKQDEVKRPSKTSAKKEPKKTATEKADTKDEKVAKITAKIPAKVAETMPDKEKIVEKLGENELDNIQEKDISKIISDKPLKKLPVEIDKIDTKASEEIVAKLDEKVTAKRELKKATPARLPAKSKGAKDVTNKMAVESKTIARKTAEPAKVKPRPVVAPPTRPIVRDSKPKSPSSSASSSPKRTPPKPTTERPVRSVRGGVRTLKPAAAEPVTALAVEKPVLTEKPTAQVKPDKRIEVVALSGDESSGSKEAIEEKAATEATKEDRPFIEPSSSDESKKDILKQKFPTTADEAPIKAVLLGTARALPAADKVQAVPAKPLEKEIVDAEMWPTEGSGKELAEPPEHVLSPEPTISASSEGVPSLVDEVIDVSLKADSSVAMQIAEPELSRVRALSSGQRTPDSLDTPREVRDGTAPSSRDEILEAMEKHQLVSREQVLEIKRRDSVDSIEGEIAMEEEEIIHPTQEADMKTAGVLAENIQSELEKPEDRALVSQALDVAKKETVEPESKELRPTSDRPDGRAIESMVHDFTEDTYAQPELVGKVEPDIKKTAPDIRATKLSDTAQEKPVESEEAEKLELAIQRADEPASVSVVHEFKEKRPIETRSLKQVEPEIQKQSDEPCRKIEKPPGETFGGVESEVAHKEHAKPGDIEEKETKGKATPEEFSFASVSGVEEKQPAMSEESQQVTPEIERPPDETLWDAVPEVELKKPTQHEGVKELQAEIEGSTPETPVSAGPEVESKKPTQLEVEEKLEQKVEISTEEKPVSAVLEVEVKPTEHHGLKELHPDVQGPTEVVPVSAEPEFEAAKPVDHQVVEKLEPEIVRPTETPVSSSPEVENKKPTGQDGDENLERKVVSSIEESPVSTEGPLEPKMPTEQEGMGKLQSPEEIRPVSSVPEVEQKTPIKEEGIKKPPPEFEMPTKETPVSPLSKAEAMMPTKIEGVVKLQKEVERPTEGTLVSTVPLVEPERSTEHEDNENHERKVERPTDQITVSAMSDVQPKKYTEHEDGEKLQTELKMTTQETPVSSELGMPTDNDGPEKLKLDVERPAERTPVSAAHEVELEKPSEHEYFQTPERQVERPAEETSGGRGPETKPKKPIAYDNAEKIEVQVDMPTVETHEGTGPQVEAMENIEQEGVGTLLPEFERPAGETPVSAFPIMEPKKPFDDEGVEMPVWEVEHSVAKTPMSAAAEVDSKKPTEHESVEKLEPEFEKSTEEYSARAVPEIKSKRPTTPQGAEKMEGDLEGSAMETFVSQVLLVEAERCTEQDGFEKKSTERTPVSAVPEVESKKPTKHDDNLERETDKSTEKPPGSAVPEVELKKPTEYEGVDKLVWEVEKPTEESPARARPELESKKPREHDGDEKPDYEVQKPTEQTLVSAVPEVESKEPTEHEGIEKLGREAEKSAEETPVSAVPEVGFKKLAEHEGDEKLDYEVQKATEETHVSAVPEVESKEPTEHEGAEKLQREIKKSTEETPVTAVPAVESEKPSEQKVSEMLKREVERPTEETSESVVPQVQPTKPTEHEGDENLEWEDEKPTEETPGRPATEVESKKLMECEVVEMLELEIAKSTEESPVSAVPEVKSKKPTAPETAEKLEKELGGSTLKTPVSTVLQVEADRSTEQDAFKKSTEETLVSAVPEVESKQPTEHEGAEKLERGTKKSIDEIPGSEVLEVESKKPTEHEGPEKLEWDTEKSPEETYLSAVPKVESKKATEHQGAEELERETEKSTDVTPVSAVPEEESKKHTELQCAEKRECDTETITEETPLSEVPEEESKKAIEHQGAEELERVTEKSTEEIPVSEVPEVDSKKPTEHEGAEKLEWDTEIITEETPLSEVPEDESKKAIEHQGAEELERVTEKSTDEIPVSEVPEVDSKKPTEHEGAEKWECDTEIITDETPLSEVPEDESKKAIEHQGAEELERVTEKSTDKIPVSEVPEVDSKKLTEHEGAEKLEWDTEMSTEEIPLSAVPEVDSKKATEHQGAEELERETEKSTEETPMSAAPDVESKKPTEHEDAEKLEWETEMSTEETPVSSVPEVESRKPSEHEGAEKLKLEAEKSTEETPVNIVHEVESKKPSEHHGVEKLEQDVEKVTEETPVSAVPEVKSKKPSEHEGAEKLEWETGKSTEEAPVSAVHEAESKKPREHEVAENLGLDAETSAEGTHLSAVPRVKFKKPSEHQGAEELERETEKSTEESHVGTLPEVESKKPTEHESAKTLDWATDKSTEETPMSAVPEIESKKPTEHEGAEKLERETEMSTEETPVSSVPEVESKKPSEHEGAEKLKREAEKSTEETPVSTVHEAESKKPSEHQGVEKLEQDVEKSSEETAVSAVPEVGSKNATEHEGAEKLKRDTEKSMEEIPLSAVPEVESRKAFEHQGAEELERETEKSTEESPVSAVPEVKSKKPLEHEGTEKQKWEAEKSTEETPLSAVSEVESKRPTEHEHAGKLERETEMSTEETPVSSVSEVESKKPSEHEAAEKLELDIEKSTEGTPVSAVHEVESKELTEHEGAEKLGREAEKSVEKTPASPLPEVGLKKPTEHEGTDKLERDIEKPTEGALDGAVREVESKSPTDHVNDEKLEREIEKTTEEKPVSAVPEVELMKSSEQNEAVQLEPKVEKSADDTPVNTVPQAEPNTPTDQGDFEKKCAEETPLNAGPAVESMKPAEHERAEKLEREVEEPIRESLVGVVPEVQSKKPTRQEDNEKLQLEVDISAAVEAAVSELSDFKPFMPTEHEGVEKRPQENERPLEESHEKAVHDVDQRTPTEFVDIERLEPATFTAVEENSTGAVTESEPRKPRSHEDIEMPKLEIEGPPMEAPLSAVPEHKTQIEHEGAEESLKAKAEKPLEETGQNLVPQVLHQTPTEQDGVEKLKPVIQRPADKTTMLYGVEPNKDAEYEVYEGLKYDFGRPLEETLVGAAPDAMLTESAEFEPVEKLDQDITASAVPDIEQKKPTDLSGVELEPYIEVPLEQTNLSAGLGAEQKEYAEREGVKKMKSIVDMLPREARASGVPQDDKKKHVEIEKPAQQLETPTEEVAVGALPEYEEKEPSEDVGVERPQRATKRPVEETTVSELADVELKKTKEHKEVERIEQEVEKPPEKTPVTAVLEAEQKKPAEEDVERVKPEVHGSPDETRVSTVPEDEWKKLIENDRARKVELEHDLSREEAPSEALPKEEKKPAKPDIAKLVEPELSQPTEKTPVSAMHNLELKKHIEHDGIEKLEPKIGLPTEGTSMSAELHKKRAEPDSAEQFESHVFRAPEETSMRAVSEEERKPTEPDNVETIERKSDRSSEDIATSAVCDVEPKKPEEYKGAVKLEADTEKPAKQTHSIIYGVDVKAPREHKGTEKVEPIIERLPQDTPVRIVPEAEQKKTTEYLCVEKLEDEIERLAMETHATAMSQVDLKEHKKIEGMEKMEPNTEMTFEEIPVTTLPNAGMESTTQDDDIKDQEPESKKQFEKTLSAVHQDEKKPAQPDTIGEVLPDTERPASELALGAAPVIEEKRTEPDTVGHLEPKVERPSVEPVASAVPEVEKPAVRTVTEIENKKHAESDSAEMPISETERLAEDTPVSGVPQVVEKKPTERQSVENLEQDIGRAREQLPVGAVTEEGGNKHAGYVPHSAEKLEAMAERPPEPDAVDSLLKDTGKKLSEPESVRKIEPELGKYQEEPPVSTEPEGQAKKATEHESVGKREAKIEGQAEYISSFTVPEGENRPTKPEFILSAVPDNEEKRLAELANAISIQKEVERTTEGSSVKSMHGGAEKKLADPEGIRKLEMETEKPADDSFESSLPQVTEKASAKHEMLPIIEQQIQKLTEEATVRTPTVAEEKEPGGGVLKEKSDIDRPSEETPVHVVSESTERKSSEPHSIQLMKHENNRPAEETARDAVLESDERLSSGRVDTHEYLEKPDDSGLTTILTYRDPTTQGDFQQGEQPIEKLLSKASESDLHEIQDKLRRDSTGYGIHEKKLDAPVAERTEIADSKAAKAEDVEKTSLHEKSVKRCDSREEKPLIETLEEKTYKTHSDEPVGETLVHIMASVVSKKPPDHDEQEFAIEKSEETASSSTKRERAERKPTKQEDIESENPCFNEQALQTPVSTFFNVADKKTSEHEDFDTQELEIVKAVQKSPIRATSEIPHEETAQAKHIEKQEAFSKPEGIFKQAHKPEDNLDDKSPVGAITEITDTKPIKPECADMTESHAYRRVDTGAAPELADEKISQPEHLEKPEPETEKPTSKAAKVVDETHIMPDMKSDDSGTEKPATSASEIPATADKLCLGTDDLYKPDTGIQKGQKLDRGVLQTAGHKHESNDMKNIVNKDTAQKPVSSFGHQEPEVAVSSEDESATKHEEVSDDKTDKFEKGSLYEQGSLDQEGIVTSPGDDTGDEDGNKSIRSDSVLDKTTAEVHEVEDVESAVDDVVDEGVVTSPSHSIDDYALHLHAESENQPYDGVHIIELQEDHKKEYLRKQKEEPSDYAKPKDMDSCEQGLTKAQGEVTLPHFETKEVEQDEEHKPSSPEAKPLADLLRKRSKDEGTQQEIGHIQLHESVGSQSFLFGDTSFSDAALPVESSDLHQPGYLPQDYEVVRSTASIPEVDGTIAEDLIAAKKQAQKQLEDEGENDGLPSFSRASSGKDQSITEKTHGLPPVNGLSDFPEYSRRPPEREDAQTEQSEKASAPVVSELPVDSSKVSDAQQLFEEPREKAHSVEPRDYEPSAPTNFERHIAYSDSVRGTDRAVDLYGSHETSIDETTAFSSYPLTSEEKDKLNTGTDDIPNLSAQKGDPSFSEMLQTQSKSTKFPEKKSLTESPDISDETSFLAEKESLTPERCMTGDYIAEKAKVTEAGHLQLVDKLSQQEPETDAAINKGHLQRDEVPETQGDKGSDELKLSSSALKDRGETLQEVALMSGGQANFLKALEESVLHVESEIISEHLDNYLNTDASPANRDEDHVDKGLPADTNRMVSVDDTLDKSVSPKPSLSSEVEKEVTKQELHLSLDAAPGVVPSVYGKAKELLEECVGATDSTSPGGALSTVSPKSSVSEDSFRSVVQKDSSRDVLVKDEQGDDRAYDESVLPASGVTTGYDFRSPTEVLKRDFVEETSHTRAKELDVTTMFPSPSQDEEGRQLLEIIKSQIVADEPADYVTTKEHDLLWAKDIPPADSSKHVPSATHGGSGDTGLDRSTDSTKKHDEMLSTILDQISKEDWDGVTHSETDKIQVSEDVAVLQSKLLVDGTTKFQLQADAPLSFEDQREPSGSGHSFVKGVPEEEKSVRVPSELSTAVHKPESPSSPIEVSEEIRPETSLLQGSVSVTRKDSKTGEDETVVPVSHISQSSLADDTLLKLSEERVPGLQSAFDASSAKGSGSSPVALKESASHPDVRTIRDTEEPGSTTDLKDAIVKGVVCDSRLSSVPEGTKAREEAPYVEADGKETTSRSSPSLVHPEHEPYVPEAPWIHHRDSQDARSSEILDQPMKDPKAMCPTSLDAPELAHMQQRVSIDYDSSITSVSDIEFAVEAKGFTTEAPDVSSHDYSKTEEGHEGEKCRSRPSSPESPPQSPVKRIAVEHPRAFKRARTTSDSKHPISTQGSSEADISSEDEDSTRKAIAPSHTHISSGGVGVPTYIPHSELCSLPQDIHPVKDQQIEYFAKGSADCVVPRGADHHYSRESPSGGHPGSFPSSEKTENLCVAHDRTPSEEPYQPSDDIAIDDKNKEEDSGVPLLPPRHAPDFTSPVSQRGIVQTPLSPLELGKTEISGDRDARLGETSSIQLKRSSIESETTSSSDDAGSSRRSLTSSKESDLMREYSKHLETSPSARFSVDSACSVTSEERSYTELEKPYQKEDSRESFSSTAREYPDDSSRSGSLYSDSTVEPSSTRDHQESISPHVSLDQIESASSVHELPPVKPERPTEIGKMEQEPSTYTALLSEKVSTVPAPLGDENATRTPEGHTSPAAKIIMTEDKQSVPDVAHWHGIASGLFAALKTELCVIDSPSMENVLDQTGKDVRGTTEQVIFDTSMKPSEKHCELDLSERIISENEKETLQEQAHWSDGKAGAAVEKETQETTSLTEHDKSHPGRKVSGEVTPVKALRFQLGEDSSIEPLADPTDASALISSSDADQSLSKEVFERKVRLEKFLEAEFLEAMATDEEDESSRASVKQSIVSTSSSSHQKDDHKVAESKDDKTEGDVTLASALSSRLPTELVCIAQSSVDLPKDITHITKCIDSQERVSPPQASPEEAARQDEPAAVAAGLASGLSVELVCMVESEELCSEIKRAEEEAIHHVIEKKSDYAVDDDGVTMQAYIERRLSDSDHFTDKKQRASPPSETVGASLEGIPTPERTTSKSFDELHLNGTSDSPLSVGLVAGLAAGLATELVCMPQSAEELCIDAPESRWPPAQGSRVEIMPPEMTASIYEELPEHIEEKPCSNTNVESMDRGTPASPVLHRTGQIPVQREVITTVTSRRVVYQNDGPPGTWTTSTFSEPPQDETEDDSRHTTVTYVYRTYTSADDDNKDDTLMASGTVPSRQGEDGLPFEILRSAAQRHAREEDGRDDGDHVTETSSRSYVYTVSSDHGDPETFIRHTDGTQTLHDPDSSIHSIAMDEVARITEMAAAAVSQSPNGWTVVHRSADSSSQRPLELTRPSELLERRNGHVTHVTETRQIVYHPSSSAEIRFPMASSTEETCLPPEGSDPKTILEFMAAQTKQAAKEMLEEQPLYEEDEEGAQEQSSLSDASPLVEEPVFGKTLQPDYPELVELSAGNTPSEPPSPHSAVHDTRARHNGESIGTTASVQRLVVVEETMPTSTLSGESETRRVVSYVEEPTTVVREEWVLEGGHGEASHVISQSSMFQHEVLTREGLTSAGITSSLASTGDDAICSAAHHHPEHGLRTAGDADQRSSLKASVASAHHEQQRIDAETLSQTEATQDTVRELQATSSERQANGRHDGDAAAPFDIRDWGKPLGLPVPPDPSSKSSKTKKSGAPVASRGASDIVYVDLTYVPHHGDPGYCDVEFFSRVRARYYVLSGTNPSQQVLDALLEAKRGWGEPDVPVTVIPTYETDALCYWIAHNQKALEEHRIDVAPSASRCTINLQDHESSCAAYRLEF